MVIIIIIVIISLFYVGFYSFLAFPLRSANLHRRAPVLGSLVIPCEPTLCATRQSTGPLLRGFLIRGSCYRGSGFRGTGLRGPFLGILVLGVPVLGIPALGVPVLVLNYAEIKFNTIFMYDTYKNHMYNYDIKYNVEVFYIIIKYRNLL